MLTSTDIYNFLVRGEDMAGLPPPPLPTEGQPVPPLPTGVDDNVENLRSRLKALIGNVEKRASEIVEPDSVFGTEEGELDPESPDVPQEWWDILESIVGDEGDTADHRKNK